MAAGAVPATAQPEIHPPEYWAPSSSKQASGPLHVVIAVVLAAMVGAEAGQERRTAPGLTRGRLVHGPWGRSEEEGTPKEGGSRLVVLWGSYRSSPGGPLAKSR